MRWGTRLHDRFMLPDAVKTDFDDVLTMLDGPDIRYPWIFFTPISSSVFPFTDVWFIGAWRWNCARPWNPGTYWARKPEAEGPHVTSIHPWNGCRSRSSGMTGDRHVVVCNGRRVPLHPTHVNGDFIGGVRYRAWQPPSCLHPTIGVHSPLTIDLVGHLVRPGRGGVAPTMSAIRADATTRCFR